MTAATAATAAAAAAASSELPASAAIAPASRPLERSFVAQ